MKRYDNGELVTKDIMQDEDWYYDYYQPESYIPQTDTYIEKDTNVNETIEKMRLEATTMLMSGEPTIIVSTVSCIYSLGSPSEWENSSISLYKDF